MTDELPNIPGIEVPCEMCGASIEAGKGGLPLNCPKCGTRLRPKTSSIWNNFTFVLFHRLLSFRGRATRKEYWTFSIISCFLFAPSCIAAYAFYVSRFDLYGDSFFSCFLIFAAFIYFTYILFAVPNTCLGVRRLHDIGISGKWAVIFIVVASIEFLLYLAQAGCSLYDLEVYLKDRFWFEENLMLLSQEHTLFVESCGEKFLPYSKSQFEAQLDQFFAAITGFRSEWGFAMSILKAISSSLAFFLIVTALIDSTKGPNKYGISRKYFELS